MSIIPYRLSEDKSELLIIGSEITERKAAQLEIERLTKASFEEKMSQQKSFLVRLLKIKKKSKIELPKMFMTVLGKCLQD